MKNSKKAWLIFRRILLLLFIVYLINYFSVSAGYYDAEMSKKTILTEEKIKEFEEDIKNGEYVDIKDYVEDEYEDTSSVIGTVGYKLSKVINDFITDKAIKTIKIIGKLFS